MRAEDWIAAGIAAVMLAVGVVLTLAMATLPLVLAGWLLGLGS